MAFDVAMFMDDHILNQTKKQGFRMPNKLEDSTLVALNENEGKTLRFITIIIITTTYS